MTKPVIEITPKTMLAYILFAIGLILLIYTTIQCILLANGTIQPIEVEIDETQSSQGVGNLLGVILQIGMYGLLIAIAYILMKTGLNITKT